MNFREKILLTIVIAVAALVVWAIGRKSEEGGNCRSSGGVWVSGRDFGICLKPDAILQPKEVK